MMCRDSDMRLAEKQIAVKKNRCLETQWLILIWHHNLAIVRYHNLVIVQSRIYLL
jgi:hypothetical protein